LQRSDKYLIFIENIPISEQAITEEMRIRMLSLHQARKAVSGKHQHP
jgi:hypothetical protein